MTEQLDKKSILEMSMGAILERVDYELTTAKATLVPTDPVTTSLYITNQPSTGEMVVAEMVPQVPGQTALDGTEQAQPKILNFKRA